ncbi:MAG: hypothetical protein OXF02_00940 [Simkaniaceae bacterium]|nr:hypothetical protein [Simkaniaceae bacterium]
MVDPTNRRNTSERPYNPKHDKEGKINPDEFKKILKPDPSSESDEKKKKRLRKSEEGDDDEEDMEKSIPLPSSETAFKELMEADKNRNSLFDPESGGVRKRVIRTPPPPPRTLFEEPPRTPLPVEEEAGPPPLPPPTSDEEYDSPPPVDSPDLPDLPPPPEPIPPPASGAIPPPASDPDPDVPRDPEETSRSTENGGQRTETDKPTHRKSDDRNKGSRNKKKEEHDGSLLAGRPKRGLSETNKKGKKPEGPRIETTILSEREESPPSEEGKEPATNSEQDTLLKKEGRKRRGPADAPDELPSSPPRREKGEENEEEEGEATLFTGSASDKGPPPSLSPTGGDEVSSPASPKIPASGAKAPKKRTIRSAVFRRLFPDILPKTKGDHRTSSPEEVPPLPSGEKLIREARRKGFPFLSSEEVASSFPVSEQALPPVTPPQNAPAYVRFSPEVYALFEKMCGTVIVQDRLGIVSTTMVISDPESVFNGAHIIIDRYATAPNSYNLQLTGTPQAVDLFNGGVSDLAAAFKQGQHAFEVNILRPAIDTDRSPLVRRKRDSGDEGGGRERNRGEDPEQE